MKSPSSLALIMVVFLLIGLPVAVIADSKTDWASPPPPSSHHNLEPRVPVQSTAGGGTKGGNANPYLADVERRIKRSWFPPFGYEAKVVIVTFKIHRYGELADLTITKSSGSPAADQAAVKAVQNAAPFLLLPATAHEDENIQLTFDSSAFNGGVHAVVQSP